jgi:hypothetical protein
VVIGLLPFDEIEAPLTAEGRGGYRRILWLRPIQRTFDSARVHAREILEAIGLKPKGRIRAAVTRIRWPQDIRRGKQAPVCRPIFVSGSSVPPPLI